MSLKTEAREIAPAATWFYTYILLIRIEFMAIPGIREIWETESFILKQRKEEVSNERKIADITTQEEGHCIMIKI